MPPLNWDVFRNLPGGSESNFEMLCRALIRRHYARYGEFAALANQPGVEFHLKLQMPCSLDEPGRWYGWQCRWYDLPSRRALGTTRRRKIAETIATTEKRLPSLTDWVLWTRHPLTEGDQRWYRGLQTDMKLHLWSADEVEEHLTGEAAILRGTYFGELVLTPNTLSDLHDQSIAPIRARWQPEVHQTVDAERELRQTLGETVTWMSLLDLADLLGTNAAEVYNETRLLNGPLADITAELAEKAQIVAATLADTHTSLDRGDLDFLRQELGNLPDQPGPALATLPRQLRARRHRASLIVTNTLAYVRLACDLLAELNVYLETRLIAVLADAGCGKTQLAAQLTMRNGDRPAGILLHGRDLQAGDSLDDLAHRVTIHGSPAPSMEALIAAVDAAGQRAHRRLPIVIDGLNEAEDPRNWKGPLASLDEILRRYPYVLVICTLRTAFADDALLPDVTRLGIPDFEHDTEEAIDRYFKHYQINPADAELPYGLLRHPLTLRLFCEVTNPRREQVVGIEAMPGSLTALFDRYLKQATERIVELAPRTRRYYEQDVRTALEEIGAALWEEKARSLDLASLRRRLGDDVRSWNESIVRALELDGVLLRVPGKTPADTSTAVVYDALAGHLVAEAVLARQGRVRLQEWLRDPATVSAMTGSPSDRHPLATDVFRALVGLTPRRLNQQLWPLLEEPLRTEALRGSADLEGTYLDAQTVAELGSLVATPSPGPHDLLDRLWHTRGAPVHPLNAEFLDGVLRSMTVADRDIRWTEWVRHHHKELLTDLIRLEEVWRARMDRHPADRLCARWVMWTLTSTVKDLRDQTTRTLYWYGRGDPAALFSLTLDALAVNDPYVAERLLAASYGVVMAHQLPEPAFAGSLAPYLEGLRDALTGATATNPTNHWLARLYVQGTVTLALTYYGDTVPQGLEVNGQVSFAPGAMVDPIRSEDQRAPEVKKTLHMDFENYTLGRLFDDRRNYDMSHSGHQGACAHVRGMVWALGWRETGLGTIDKGLSSFSYRGHQTLIERYGKKYGWIGFYTYAGMLADKGRLPTHHGRLSDMQIDPSFPEPPSPAPFHLPIWALRTPADDRHWIRRGIITVPNELLYRKDIGPHPGPWVAVHGHLKTDNQTPGRQVFGILTALLVAESDADYLVDVLSTREYPGRWWLPEVPDDHYTFAGEVPWSPEFAQEGADGDTRYLYREAVRVEDAVAIEVEILAHRYSWETYHSTLNRAGGSLVPSRPFSSAFDLRGVPQTFGQTMPDGTTCALSFTAPAGFNGDLLYLREDLVCQYAAGRRLVWFVWGERQLDLHRREPDWLINARRERADVWRYIRKGGELSPAFA
ncbi:MAG: hypothetical protein KJ650_07415 [Firmicutes bacterium]|nr:hypothetical protein [Bacillota bacterium]MBV1727858.1 hypothetical protein [Desulforudis sp.]MBV1735298.1 hypothetical protein [Desulforudis sp.]MBV1769439.1 hypothetical protein [Desulforudis sp.]